MTDPVHVIGASGRSGLALCRRLLADGIPVVPVVRDPAKWAATGLPEAIRAGGPARRRATLRDALAGATRIVSCAHARHTRAILAAAPETATLVLLGSTRKFTRWPDAHGNGVLAGEAALLALRSAGVMLHPTMIYGAQGEDNVQRLAALLRRLPVLPLPGGGRFLVQPIHQGDVTRCIRAALARCWDGPNSLVIAGPEPMPYADFVRAVAAAAGLRRPRILPFPAGPLIAGGRADPARCRACPRCSAEEIRRLMEDKAFDIGPMRDAARCRANSVGRRACADLRVRRSRNPDVTFGEPNADYQPHRRISPRDDRMAAGSARASGTVDAGSRAPRRWCGRSWRHSASMRSSRAWRRHGVVGVIRAGSSDRAIGLRADMDALPIQEETGLPHASRTPA